MDTTGHIDQEVWWQYLAKPTPEYRDILVNKYEPYVNMLAAKLYANRQVREIEFEEYKQLGMVGLLESIDKYNPKNSTSFKTYASHRIKGAILDGIEKYCERQQQITARARLREERMQHLLEEVALQEQDVFFKLLDIAVGTAIGFMLEDTHMYQINEEVSEYNVYKSRELNDLAKMMARLVSTLPKQEEEVIRLHYYQHHRFDHIAEKMGITKSRISQIHHKALRRLHEHYDELKLLRTDY